MATSIKSAVEQRRRSGGGGGKAGDWAHGSLVADGAAAAAAAAAATAARRMERRVSERGASFLPASTRSRELSSAKYRTALTVRPPPPRRRCGAAGGGGGFAAVSDFGALTGDRIVLPAYVVEPAGDAAAAAAAALQASRSRAAVDGRGYGAAGDLRRAAKESSAMTSYVSSRSVDDLRGAEVSRSRIKEWYNLVLRPVSRRPDYALPIVCRAPREDAAPPQFSYLRPTEGLFYSVSRSLPQKTYDVSPEFLSEHRKSVAVREMASNTLKFGWG